MKMKPLLTCLKSQIKLLLYMAFLTLFVYAPALAQERKISGTVTGAEDNSPMPGVNVTVKGKATGAITDVNGKYSIPVSGNDAILVFSFIGFNSQEVTIGGQAVVDVKMATSATQLAEIVVTSLGIKREKKALTYAAQNISSADIMATRSLNVANNLSGKIAGLELVKSNSGVGSPSRVMLRGYRSIARSNQPLYVVDGQPINNDTDSPYSENGGYAFSDGISNVNPDDIESLTVLKGPSATALYGTRANNGAIVIVTKKGTSRKGIGVEYNLNASVETPVILTKFQNMFGQGSAGIYSKNSENVWGPELDGRQVNHWTPNSNSVNYPNGVNTDTTYSYVGHPNNFKDYLQKGLNLTNSLSITTGNNDLQGYFSYTNVNSNGIVPGNTLKSNNLNARITGNLTKKLSFDTKLTYYNMNVENRVSTGDAYENPMRAILRMPTNISNAQASDYKYIDNNGNIRQNYWNPGSNGGENPFWMLHMIPENDSRDRVLTMVSAKYEIIKGLSVQLRSSYDYIYDNMIREEYNDTYTIADFGRYYSRNNWNRELNNEILLNYNTPIGSDFTLNASAGGNLLTQKYYGVSTDNGSLLKPDLFTTTNAQNLTAGDYGATKKLNSVYAFATIGFKNFLFLDLTGRNDWSSTLPPASWSYFYPSAGLTWVISDLVKMPAWLTFAKVRASLAQVGNDTDPYQLSPVYNFAPGGSNGFAHRGTVFPTPNLKPEITTSQEFGADIRFFQNRVGIDFTYYKSNSRNQLLSIPLPIASGYNSKFINAGNIQNTGYELTLNIKPLVGDFTWDIDINGSRNVNKVIELAEGVTSYVIQGRSWMTTVKVEVGQPFGEVYTRGFLRNADNKVIVNGTTGLPLCTSGQEVRMGNYTPKALFGLKNSFTYKDFDFGFLIDARIGGDVFSFTEANLSALGVSDYTLEGRDGKAVSNNLYHATAGQDGFVVNGVIQEKDADGNVTSERENDIIISPENYWQSLGGRNTPVGEVYKYDGTNVRLQEVTLGYTKRLPNFPLKSIRIAVYSNNLLFIVNKAKLLDPNLMVGNTNVQGTEGFGLPGTRVVGMNLRVNF